MKCQQQVAFKLYEIRSDEKYYTCSLWSNALVLIYLQLCPTCMINLNATPGSLEITAQRT